MRFKNEEHSGHLYVGKELHQYEIELLSLLVEEMYQMWDTQLFSWGKSNIAGLTSVKLLAYTEQSTRIACITLNISVWYR